MFVDACAIIAIIMREDTAQDYTEALGRARRPFTSDLASWEATIILARPDRLDFGYTEAAGTVLDWLDGWGVELREPTSSRDILAHAVAVAETHGLGKRALSNFRLFSLRPRPGDRRADADARPPVAPDRPRDGSLKPPQVSGRQT